LSFCLELISEQIIIFSLVDSLKKVSKKWEIIIGTFEYYLGGRTFLQFNKNYSDYSYFDSFYANIFQECSSKKQIE